MFILFMLLGSFCCLTSFSILGSLGSLFSLCALCLYRTLCFPYRFSLLPHSPNCNVVYYEVLLKVSNPAK